MEVYEIKLPTKEECSEMEELFLGDNYYHDNYKKGFIPYKAPDGTICYNNGFKKTEFQLNTNNGYLLSLLMILDTDTLQQPKLTLNDGAMLFFPEDGKAVYYKFYLSGKRIASDDYSKLRDDNAREAALLKTFEQLLKECEVR